MDAATYLQINLIPILALIIMRANTGKTLTYSWRSRALRFMMVLLVLTMVLNMAARLLNGIQLPGVGIVLWICNLVYFALLDFTIYLWYLYVQDIVDNGIGQRGIKVLGPSMPLIVFLVVLVTSPWTGAIFYIDADNCYVRGKLFAVHVVVTLIYALGATILALNHCRRETQEERCKELLCLAGFVILPMCGGILQVVFYGLELMLPFTAASLLMIYIDVQQRQVTRDALTGLNNRRRLEQYLTELDEQDWGKDSCHLILLDVNRFKKINDTYGHVTGDSVLKLVADQMKKVYGNTHSFLARYGGDEFVIVLKGKTDSEAAESLRTLHESIAKMNWGEGSPWKITVSAGCARYGEVPMRSVRELMKLADSRMYEEKNKNRQ